MVRPDGGPPQAVRPVQPSGIACQYHKAGFSCSRRFSSAAFPPTVPPEAARDRMTDPGGLASACHDAPIAERRWSVFVRRRFVWLRPKAPDG